MTKHIITTGLVLVTSAIASGTAQASVSPLSLSKVVTLAGIDAADDFDGYPDASTLGDDIVPASMGLRDGALFVDEDGQAMAVLELDDHRAAATWVFVHELHCTGSVEDGCLGGYTIDRILTIDTIQRSTDRARVEATLSGPVDGMQPVGTIQFDAGLSDDTIWTMMEVVDADGVSTGWALDSANLADTDTQPTGQGDNGFAAGALAGWIIGGIGGAVAGAGTGPGVLATMAAGALGGASAGGSLGDAIEDLVSGGSGEGDGDGGDGGDEEGGEDNDDGGEKD